MTDYEAFLLRIAVDECEGIDLIHDHEGWHAGLLPPRPELADALTALLLDHHVDVPKVAPAISSKALTLCWGPEATDWIERRSQSLD